MLHDVEDIVKTWESTGLLKNSRDPFNLALILQTQSRVNIWRQRETGMASQLQKVSIPVINRVCHRKPDMFQGLIDYQECKDVYRLGRMPKGHNVDIGVDLVKRIMHLDLGCLYFAGIVEKNDQVYLIADTVE